MHLGYMQKLRDACVIAWISFKKGKVLHLVATCLSRSKILDMASLKITGQLGVEQQELEQC